MIYKDSKFEIDDKQIKFRNTSIMTFLIIFISMLTSSFLFSKGNTFHIAGSLTGLMIMYFIIRWYFEPYLKNTINLLDIEYVKTGIWDKSIDKNRNFWGTGKYKYHFPTGLNKKTNPEVIFVHIKGRKAAVGFVPENIENVISVFKEKGIKTISATSSSEST